MAGASPGGCSRAMLGLMALLLALSACGVAESAAARDPMMCERNPSCSKGRSSYADCTRQCVDDPDCIKRCEQVQKQVDSMGR